MLYPNKYALSEKFVGSSRWIHSGKLECRLGQTPRLRLRINCSDERAAGPEQQTTGITYIEEASCASRKIGDDEMNLDNEGTVMANWRMSEERGGHVGGQVEAPAKKLADSVGAKLEIQLPMGALT